MESLRDDIVDIMRFSGYEALSAPDGEHGLALAIAHHPDLILCDVMMPGLDGFQVFEKLRTNALTASIPVIFLTAREDQRRQILALGQNVECVIKPFALPLLLETIAKLIGKPNTKD
jgi:DNA-binding response OmpR family regulator